MTASSPEPLLEVDRATIHYGEGARTPAAVEDVSFAVDAGERVMLLGPSGSGKSTLLKAIGGFIRPTSGAVRLSGVPVTRPGPERLLVFQEFDQLLPWKTVRQNIAFPLVVSAGLSHADADARAMEFVRKVKLERVADAYPHTLSGGMKQRIAIARCLAMKPRVVLMDEPFAALDALTRRQMQDELLGLWQASSFTMIFVTHSIIEALLIGSRVILLSSHPGRVVGQWQVPPSGADDSLREEIEQKLFGAAGAEGGVP